MRFQVLGGALALAATATYAQNATFCPTGDICYTVNVPSTGEKDLFFQISGPSTMSWIGLGQGSGMSGSNIFIIYANSAGTNVTLSPRLGLGHVEPNADTAAMVTLLDGSMISNGMMVANVKCSNCQSWSGGTMDFTSDSTGWIYAYKSGSALNADSPSASIVKHDDSGTFDLNLAAATGGMSNRNPFTGTTLSSTTSTGSTSPMNLTSTMGSDTGGGSSDDAGPSETMISNATIAHGIMGAVAFLLLFPSGAIILRIFDFRGIIWVHAGLQIFGYLVALALMETGVWIAVSNEELMMGHPVIGLFVVCGLSLQPFLGLGHHLLFRRKGRKNVLTYPHIWWGRILITIGIINGAFGLQLSGSSMKLLVAYISVASVVWAIWMGLAALTWMRGQRAQKVKGKPTIIHMQSFDSL